MTRIPFDREALRRELDERPFRQRSGDGGRRPHWSVIAADEAMWEPRADEPPEDNPDRDSETAWADRLADEDRTLTDELPPGYDSRVWRQSL